jgi:hypothetical protein
LDIRTSSPQIGKGESFGIRPFILLNLIAGAGEPAHIVFAMRWIGSFDLLAGHRNSPPRDLPYGYAAEIISAA